MKNKAIGGRWRSPMPIILAVLAPVFLAPAPSRAAEAQLTRPSDTLIEISGGSGKQAWRLRYGTSPASLGLAEPLLAVTEGHRASFSHVWQSPGGLPLAPQKSSQEEAKKIVPELEEAIRRDPLSPWFGIAPGKLLRDVGDPGAKQAFEKAVQVPSTDFTELLPISARLERFGEHRVATKAFKRGYCNFWERGNDPRLFMGLIGKLILYQPWSPDGAGKDGPQRRELIEQTYELFPN